MILTCPGCAVRFVIPRSEDELRDMEVTHPACGHAFAPFAQRSEPVERTSAAPEPVALEASCSEAEACIDDVCDDEEGRPVHIDTHRLRKELMRATTLPFRHLLPKLATAGFASAAAAELVFLFDHGVDGALPAAHYTLALLGMGR